MRTKKICVLCCTAVAFLAATACGTSDGSTDKTLSSNDVSANNQNNQISKSILRCNVRLSSQRLKSLCGLFGDKYRQGQNGETKILKI